METDFILEKRLKALDPQLHEKFAQSIFVIQRILESYTVLFPTFTDHTILHSIDVADFCSKLIADQIEKFNADELYVLLMSCYLHDAGMGISKKDYESFRQIINLPKVPEEEITDQIRKYHHEFSGLFIKKYSALFDIPSEKHTWAIIQVSRGHRKTELKDKNEYPKDFTVPNGNKISLAYLASLIRIADEIDVAQDRNISFLFDINKIKNEESLMAFAMHKAIKSVAVLDDCYQMTIDTSDAKVLENVLNQNKKIQNTIDYCCNIIDAETPYTIKQRTIKTIILNK